MGEAVTHQDPEPIVRYYPDSGSLTIEVGRPLVDGETIADGVVVFYDAEDSNSVSGIYIYDAEAVLKPIIDVVVARTRNQTRERIIQPRKQKVKATVQVRAGS